jgi:hypothetical protein
VVVSTDYNYDGRVAPTYMYSSPSTELAVESKYYHITFDYRFSRSAPELLQQARVSCVRKAFDLLSLG